MLAKLVRTLPEGPEWEYELKFDGYRLEAIKDGDKVRLYSRRGNDFTRKFARIATAVSKINLSSAGSAKEEAASFILDGEAVIAPAALSLTPGFSPVNTAAPEAQTVSTVC